MSTLSTFISKNRLSRDFSRTAECYFIPLAEEIKLHQSSAGTPYFVGINGSQGSGKSTLSEFIQDYLTETYGLKVIVMSLDDFYFSSLERNIIAADVHSLFKTRGVPGTHNMSQAKNVLYALKQQQPTMIPRFNKATDNPYPESAWTIVADAVDIVIFEGWCWGVEPQAYAQLKQPVNQFEATQDPQAIWRKHTNQQLSLHYQALYPLMDKWVMLKAPSFEDVFTWRLEQEKKLSEATRTCDQSAIMNEQQVLSFIQYYQRLTEHALRTLPNKCDHVYALNSARVITSHITKDAHA